jgi:hypothetical protein
MGRKKEKDMSVLSNFLERYTRKPTKQELRKFTSVTAVKMKGRKKQSK